jgi:hypothetical protein
MREIPYVLYSLAQVPAQGNIQRMATGVEILEIPQNKTATQEPYLPYFTWLYWPEFGSTMGALSCPEGGKMGVLGV